MVKSVPGTFHRIAATWINERGQPSGPPGAEIRQALSRGPRTTAQPAAGDLGSRRLDVVVLHDHRPFTTSSPSGPPCAVSEDGRSAWLVFARVQVGASLARLCAASRAASFGGMADGLMRLVASAPSAPGGARGAPLMVGDPGIAAPNVSRLQHERGMKSMGGRRSIRSRSRILACSSCFGLPTADCTLVTR
jgi:hypothetical protein